VDKCITGKVFKLINFNNNMKKRVNLKIFLFLFIVLFLIELISSSTITRDVPTSAKASTNFLINFTAANTPSGKWGAIIVENINGGCLINSKTTYKDVMLSTGGLTKSISVSAPASGTCHLTGGYYQFSEDSNPTGFTEAIISINSCETNADCNDGNSCTIDVCSSNTCILSPITTCSLSSDSCCPSGCNVTNDNDCTATCPNGICGTSENCGNCAADCSCTGNSVCQPLNSGSDIKGCLCTTNWVCSDWSACSSGTQTRTCSDANNCGTNSGKPALTQSCTIDNGNNNGGGSGGSGSSGGTTPRISVAPTHVNDTSNTAGNQARGNENNNNNNTPETPNTTANKNPWFILLIILGIIILLAIIIFVIYMRKKKAPSPSLGKK